MEAAPGPVFNIQELWDAGLDDRDQLIFHTGILDDLGLVQREDREPGFGFTRGLDGHEQWMPVPLRLTAQGHQFIEALRNKQVFATLKRGFKDASLSTLRDVSKTLLEAFIKKKIEEVLKDPTWPISE
jgi:hypothetical protein